MNYTKESCPVCGKQFTETDDIAVCPVCGTPHHRECYLEQKHCSNEEKHAEGFEWQASDEPVLPFVEHLNRERNGNAEKTACPYCGMENDVGEPVCKYCGASLNNGNFGNEQNQDGRVFIPSAFGPNVVQIQPNDVIGGHTVSDMADFVQRNAEKYIPKFYKIERTGNKVSFNWAAFLFAPYWFFYRKMHVIGFAFMIISLLVSVLCTTPDVQAASKELTAAYEQFLSGNSQITQQQLSNMAMSLYMMPEMLISSGFSVLMHIFAGLFANALYKKKVQKDINWAKEAANSPEAYRILLFKRGGVSLFMVVLSAVGLFCAEQIISMFIMGGGNTI